MTRYADLPCNLALKFDGVFAKMLQFLRDEVPRPPARLRFWTPFGDFRPSNPVLAPVNNFWIQL
jgi:hypothetical protein